MVEQVKNQDVKGDVRANGNVGAQDDGWVEMPSNRPIYNPSLCKSRPLVGYLLRLQQMPEADSGPWNAFVIKTTQPTLAVDGFEDAEKAVEVPAGAEVLLVETTKLRDLRGFLLPDRMIEVRVTPDKLQPIGGSKKMWTYKIQANAKSAKPRPSIYGLAAAPAPRGALPAAGGFTGEGDEIPF